MRHLPDPPNGLMDALFAALFMWGRDHDYEWFTLGMAPLSGLRHGPLTPLWNQLGAVIFQYGGKFYNFTGLRAWKEKYQPVWEPRYLAVPGLWDLPAALLDITALIGGGRDGTAGKRRAAADPPLNSET